MDTKPLKAVPTPLRRRWHFFLQHSLPVAAWLGALALLALLAQRHTAREAVCVGLLETREAAVAPVADGVLARLGVDLHDVVQSGDVVAWLDERPLLAERGVVEAELAHYQGQLAAERVASQQRQADRQVETRRFQNDLESARIAHAERLAGQERDKSALERMGILMQRQEKAAASGLLDAVTYEQTRMEYEALRTLIQRNETVLAETQTATQSAEKRWTEYMAQCALIQEEALLKPFEQMVAVQQARIQEIDARIAQCALRAPISGRVTSVLCRAGQTAPLGLPILTISDPSATRVLAYVEEHVALDWKPGDTVDVRAERLPGYQVTARVASAAPSVAEFPLRLQRFGLPPQWGRTVLIDGLPPEHPFLPGEAVMLRLAPAGQG